MLTTRLFVILALYFCVCDGVERSWTVDFNTSSGIITSLTNGVVELVDSLTVVGNLPVFWLGANSSLYFETILDEPCSQEGLTSWSCVGSVLLPAAIDAPLSCQGHADLQIFYTVSFIDMNITAAAALLEQNVSLSALVDGCAPGDFLAIALPRAITLAGEASRSGGMFERHLSTHLISGEALDVASATSGTYNNVVFVSAGARWRAPDKNAPESPYLFSVPAMDEYLASTSKGENSNLVLTTLCDPYHLTNFELGYASNQSRWSFALNCSDVNIGCFMDEPILKRSFYTTIADTGDISVDARMQRLYATALAHIPPAPSWTKEIALTDYDYFSPLPPSINGFEADMDALAAKIPIDKRGSVAVCIHGWYGLIGQYTLATINGTALLDTWTVFPDGAGYMNKVTKLPMGPITMTKQGIHQRINKAKGYGFRVLLYFADGLNSCEGVPFWQDQVELTTYSGGEWKGPDSIGRLFARNPLHPRTFQEFTNLATGILIEYGKSIDGLVWDETFELVNDQPGVAESAPGYAGKGMMKLIEAVASIVHTSTLCTQCVLLVAGCMVQMSMPNALLSDGTYEDVGLNVAAAPYGVLPNWRNALWECGWNDVSSIPEKREEGMVEFNVPVGISNGWVDYVGFANMTEEEKDYFVGLALMNHTNRTGPRWK